MKSMPDIDAKPAAIKKLTAGEDSSPPFLLAGHHCH